MIPVMIVEDEFLVRVGLRSMIDWEKHGFEVVADASNGEKGLERFEACRPYLILTDIRMSPIDGLEMMRRIREKDEGVRFIVISAYSEFEYARKAIEYGVELYLDKSCFTEADIAPALEKVAHQYRRECMDAPPRVPDRGEFDAAFPAQAGEEELNGWFEAAGIGLAPKRIAACRRDKSGYRPRNPALDLTIASELLAREDFFSRPFRHGDFTVIVLDDQCPEAVEVALRHLLDTLCEYAGAPVYMGLSARFYKPAHVQQAASEACKTCNDFLFDKGVLLRVYRRETPDPEQDKQLRLCCDEVRSRVYAGDREGIDGAVRRAVLCATSYRTLERIVFSIIMSLEALDRSTLVSAAFSAVMRDDVGETCRALAAWAQGLCAPAALAPGHDSVDEIIAYVKEHLAEDVSLGRLSERFHFSQNYLGQLFYQKAGIYLNTYVANLRVSRACELLLSTELSVSEVGQRVGVDDPHYFSKLFKNRMGVSPNKYRRMWAE